MRIRSVAVFCAVMCWSLPTFAQFAVEGFEPTPNQEHDILNVSTANVAPTLVPTLSLFTHFVDDAMVFKIDDEPAGRVLNDQLKLELSAALGLVDWIDIGFTLPMTAYQVGDVVPFSTAPVSEFAFSDPRVHLKTRFLPERVAGLGAAVQIVGYLPLGSQSDYHSDGELRVEPRLIIDYEIENTLNIALNGGYQIRPERSIANVGSDDWIRLGAGLAISLTDALELLSTISGGVALADGTDPNDPTQVVSNTFGRPFELNGGLRVALPANLTLVLGGGAGITSGVGSPDFRIFAGLSHQALSQSASDALAGKGDQDLNDPDGDGILGDADDCPNEAEDLDEFQDQDGCPEPDNDDDGILDYQDRCPIVAGIAEKQGCPFLDKDGDDIDDESDGCPEDPEDVDGFEDDDGCPELDNDQDGIADADDKCPEQKEVINGVDDEDGCPDSGDTKVIVTDDQIQILETIYFDTGKAKIQDRSFNLLNQVASVLRANPKITKVRIEGHTDSRGRAQKNQDLSQRRAQAVATYLREVGIDASRLEAVGYGELRPTADNATREGRTLNRRVEFLIVDVEQ